MKVFRKGNLSEAEIMQWLTGLRAHAYAPESSFTVSAVFKALTPDGSDYYFGGVNVENIDHRLTTHAEEGAIAAMVTALGRSARIAEGWVMGAPENDKAADTLASCCGKCRQQIAGFASKDVKIHSFSPNGQKSSTTVGAFLPDLFTFRQYLPDTANSKKSTAPLSAQEISERLTRTVMPAEKELLAWLKQIESVDDASKISQSLVIKLDNDACVAGTKVEEAAFNCISAAQSALAAATAEFGVCVVREAWVYTKGRDGKEVPTGHVGTLAMSALQTLLQCAEHREIPVHFFEGDGGGLQTTLSAAAQMAPTSSHPFYKKQ